MRGNKEFDKKHLEQLVVKYGGDFCQKRTDNNEATIVSSVDTSKLERHSIGQRFGLIRLFVVPVVKGHIRKGLAILKPDWIIESTKKERMLPLISESVRGFDLHTSF